MDPQLDMKSRMRKHIRSVKRLASSLSAHPPRADGPVDDGSFVVLLDQEEQPGDHPITARHLLDHYDSTYAPPSSPGHVIQIQSLADQGAGSSTAAITAARNDWSCECSFHPGANRSTDCTGSFL